jgi:hypothetical protein
MSDSSGGVSARPPSIADVAWSASITAVKASVIALAVDAFVNSSSARYRGKAMKVRAVGYAGGLLVVPVAWRMAGRKEPYPRVDDAVHFANGALLAGVVGTLAQSRTRTGWEAGAFAAVAGVAAGAVWEMVEWVAMKLGARGMDLTYDDTMEDLIETSAGALLGGFVTLLRHPTRLRRFPGRADDPIVARI